METELLAPAKDKKTAFSAINCGCDAIYIGANLFGARKNASNDLDDIKEIINYAHKFYVKVYVTINTILTDEEVNQAKILINKLYELNADAIIIQDMALLELAINNELPPICIHASTQCDNRNVEKVKFFDEIGIPRVILARELSLKQIENICNNTKCEIETFIHGALCVSYSGQCYMSCANGGRSANRGECAQSCRKKYTLITETGKIIAKDKYLLSLKDFNASQHLKSLVDIGVKSFKIEGRLKDANYVKNTVAFYRTELDKISKKTSSGMINFDFEPNLNKSFNRSFTDYFLNSRTECFNINSPKSIGENLGKVTFIGKNYFEINAKINPQDGLCYFVNDELEGFLVNKVDGKKIYPNNMKNIQKGLNIYRNYDSEFEKKLNNTKTKRRIRVKFFYQNGILTAKDEDNNIVKTVIESNEIAKNPEKMKDNFITQLQKTGETDFVVTEINICNDIPFIAISKINEIRRDILTDLMELRLKNYKCKRQNKLQYAKYPQKEINYRGNVHNKKAREFYENCKCEVTEMSYESKNQKNIELMRTKHCLKYAFNICKSPEKLYLIDEKGKKYKLEFDCKNCEMAIIK